MNPTRWANVRYVATLILAVALAAIPAAFALGAAWTVLRWAAGLP